jgi:cell division septum initiation protein DivIVA
MESIDRLEDRIDKLFQRIKALEQENAALAQELDKERRVKDSVLGRIDGLLKRIQEEAIG